MPVKQVAGSSSDVVCPVFRVSSRVFPKRFIRLAYIFVTVDDNQMYTLSTSGYYNKLNKDPSNKIERQIRKSIQESTIPKEDHHFLRTVNHHNAKKSERMKPFKIDRQY